MILERLQVGEHLLHVKIHHWTQLAFDLPQDPQAIGASLRVIRLRLHLINELV